MLVLAANTAFNGFPLLGSVLAQDRFMPRQLHTRGDKLVFSNGILLLAGFAMLLIVAFDADVTRLIQLYIIGVFTSFTIGQWGMVRHWNREMRLEHDPAARRRMRRSQIINTVGGSLTTVVLVIIVLTKFTHGAWLVLVAMPILFVLMKAINRHYSHVSEQLVPDTDSRMLPSKVHAVVLVSKVHKPTLRALAFARATRPDALTALTVNVDDADTRALQADWERYDIPVPLTVVESPYREITRPVRRLRQGHPPGQPAGAGRGVRPAVRRRPLVGERAAQPERAAAPRPAAVPARRHDHHRAVAAGELPRPGGRRPRRPGPAPGDLRRGLTEDEVESTPMAERRRPTLARGRPERGRRGGGWTGTEFEVTVGPVAHGGHCVARHEGRVVFVRHTLPGERVVVRVTEDRHPGFCRADAIEVLEASPDRVERPCPYSGPGPLRRLRLAARRPGRAAHG